MPEQVKQTREFSATELEATADSALAVIEKLGPDAPLLVDAWVKAGNGAAVATVADRGTGPARKAARRGLNVLRSRGIKVDTAPRVASLGAPSDLVTEAWLLPPDTHGSSVIVITSRSVTSRVETAFFQINDGFGVQSASVGELSGSKLRESLKRSGLGVDPVKIPVAYARFRVAAARKKLKEGNFPEPLAMTNAEALLGPAPEAEEPHPLDAEGLALADEDVKEYASRSAALHGLPEFAPWLPDANAMQELVVEIGKHVPQGDERPPPEEMTKIIAETVNAATDRYFVPERRALLLQRMKDSALSVLQSHGELRALEVVAAMRSIESAGLITDPPHEVPFLRSFFEKALMAMAYQSGGRLRVPRPEAAPSSELSTG